MNPTVVSRRTRKPTGNQPVRVPKTAELIADDIRRRIVLGELVEGEALPNEGELMVQFSVSRPTLREAFRILEAQSLIQVRRGAHGGARVSLPQTASAAQSVGMLLQMRGATVAEMLEARLIIEPPLARRLAEQHTHENLKVLNQHLAQEREAIDDYPRYAELSAHFHQLLVECSGNTAMSLIVGMINDIFVRHASQFVASHRRDQRQLNELSYTNHAKLVKAIESGRAAQAESMWREHMTLLRDVTLSELGGKTVLDLY